MTYTLKIRPAYNSDDLLLEFESVTGERPAFLGTLEDELTRIDAEQTDVDTHRRTRDEYLIAYDSDCGPFELDMDCWDLPFILAPHNQEAIEEIATLLRDSEAFVEVEADFSEY